MGNNKGDLQTKMAKLKISYANSLPEKIEGIKTAARALLSGSTSKENFYTLETVHALTHKLAGSAGTFGFKKLSIANKELEFLLANIINEKLELTDEVRAEITRLLSIIEESARLEKESPQAAHAPETPNLTPG